MPLDIKLTDVTSKISAVFARCLVYKSLTLNDFAIPIAVHKINYSKKVLHHLIFTAFLSDVLYSERCSLCRRQSDSNSPERRV